MSLFQSQDSFWYALAIIFFIIEVGTPNGVFLFVSLAAACTGASITFYLINPDALQAQLIVFLLFTAIWAAVLWKPIKNFLRGRKNRAYEDIRGSSATVRNNPLKKGHKGQASWSGSIMNAKLSDTSSVESIEVGKEVIIKEIDGNTLIVDLKGE